MNSVLFCKFLTLFNPVMCRYFEQIFNESGCNELVEKFGSWFTLDRNPRAQIFKRDHTTVKDLDSMIRLMRLNASQLCPLPLPPRAWKKMALSRVLTSSNLCVCLLRYNDFKEDPLSKCDGCDPPANGENAISARSDLNPANGTYPFGALRQRQHGGTDMKVFLLSITRPQAPSRNVSMVRLEIVAHPDALFVCVFPAQLTSYGMFRDYAMVAVNGPTWDQVPPFQWSTSPYKDLLHMGHPDTWTFKPVKVTWAP